MPDQIDGWIDDVKPADRYPVVDCPVGQANATELRPGDDAVLVARDGSGGDRPSRSP